MAGEDVTFFSPDVARTKSMPDKFGGQIYRESRLSAIRTQILGGGLGSRGQAYWNAVMARPATYALAGPLSPWEFPRYYINPDESNAKTAIVNADVAAAFDYALRYQVLGNSTDAAQTVKVLNAYGGITSYVDQYDGPLVWVQMWPILMQAAYLVKGSPAYTATVHNNFVTGTLRGSRELEDIAFTRTNNWAAVGIACEIMLAAFINDRPRFDRALTQWRYLFSDQIDNGITLQGAVRYNVPTKEIYREGGIQVGNGSSGLSYSNMTLWGFACGAEWARLNGEWLFDFVAPNGASLKGLYENVALWTAQPTQTNLWFNTSAVTNPPGSGYGYGVSRPWVDVLGELWPNSNTDVVREKYNSSSSPRSLLGHELLYRGIPLLG